LVTDYNEKLKPHGLQFIECQKGLGPTRAAGTFLSVQIAGIRLRVQVTDDYQIDVRLNDRVVSTSSIGSSSKWPDDGAFPVDHLKSLLAGAASAALQQKGK